MNKFQEAMKNIRFDILNCGDCDGDNDKSICKTKCVKNKDLSLLQELIDKQTPLTVNYIADGYADGYPVYDTAICPNCTRTFEVFDEEHYNYCPTCGQHLNWSEENE